MTKTLALALALCSASVARAYTVESVTIEAITTVGLHAERGEIVRSLIKNELQSSGIKVVDHGGEGTMRGSLTQLDRTIVLHLNFEQGNVARSRQAKLQSFDEIDTGVHRLVRAVLKNVAVGETITQGEILERDGESQARLQSVRGWEFAVGSSLPLVGLPAKNLMWAFSLGYAWDIRDAFVEVRGDITQGFGNSTQGYGSFALGAQWVWMETDQAAFFAGPEFGFGVANATDLVTATGFHLGGDIGVLLLRHADINLDLRFRVSILTSDLRGGIPIIASLLFGLHF